ncbi:MAG: hypothetical protein E7442_04090 [Ruminococcaceae bacterium]|nr:hypothetical protein [Oscillospiraceae bacterium]
MATTVSLPLTATRYRGTGVDTQVTGDYVGNVYAGGYAEYYRMRLAFKPGRALSRVVLDLSFGGHNQVGNVSYYYTVAGQCPGTHSTEGTVFSWSGKSASITLEGRFEADTTYYIWVWSPSAGLGYVVLSSYSAEGTIAAPALYVKTEAGWVEIKGLYAKGSSGWTEVKTLHARTSSGWQES